MSYYFLSYCHVFAIVVLIVFCPWNYSHKIPRKILAVLFVWFGLVFLFARNHSLYYTFIKENKNQLKQYLICKHFPYYSIYTNIQCIDFRCSMSFMTILIFITNSQSKYRIYESSSCCLSASLYTQAATFVILITINKFDIFLNFI